MEQTVNTWQKGLQMDTHPMVQGNDTLSDALNATFITMNGNEIILQNDMGNRKVNRAYLPEGYVPVGIKEYGGIIYIASYNPVNNRGQVGSFPSPEEFIDIDADKDSNIDFDFSHFEYKGLNFIQETSKIYTLTDNLHIGDKFSIYIPSLGYGTANNPSSRTFGELYVSKYGNSTNNKKYSIYVGVLNSQNVFVDITNSLKLESKDYYDTVSQTNRRNPQYYIRPYDKTNKDIPENYYKYKIAGPLALKIEFNAPYSSYYSIGGVKVEKDGNYYATLYVTMTMTYDGQGCSNESGNNRWIKFYRDIATDDYQEVDIDSCRIVQEPRETTSGYEVVIKNIYRDVPVTTTDYDPTAEETYIEDLRFFTEEYCFINNLVYADLTAEQIQNITNKYIEAHKKRYINYFIGVPCCFNNNYYGSITKAGEQFNPYVRNLSYFGTIDYNMLSSSAFDVAIWQFETVSGGLDLRCGFTFLEETPDKKWNIAIKCTEVSDPNKVITKWLFDDLNNANAVGYHESTISFSSATDGITYGDAYYVDITYYDYEKDYEITINDYWIFYTTLFNEHYGDDDLTVQNGCKIQNVVNPKLRTVTRNGNSESYDESLVQKALLTVPLTYNCSVENYKFKPGEPNTGDGLNSLYKLIGENDPIPSDTKTLNYSEAVEVDQAIIQGSFSELNNKYPRYLIQQIANTEPKDLTLSLRDDISPEIYSHSNSNGTYTLFSGGQVVNQSIKANGDNTFTMSFKGIINAIATFSMGITSLSGVKKIYKLENGGSWNTYDLGGSDNNFMHTYIDFTADGKNMVWTKSSNTPIIRGLTNTFHQYTQGGDLDGIYENDTSSIFEQFGKFINNYKVNETESLSSSTIDISQVCIKMSDLGGNTTIGNFQYFCKVNDVYDPPKQAGLWKVKSFKNNDGSYKYIPYTCSCDNANNSNYDSVSSVIKQFIWGIGEDDTNYYFPNQALTVSNNTITDQNGNRYYLYGINQNNVTTNLPQDYDNFIARFDNVFKIDSNAIPDSKLGIFKFQVNSSAIDIDLGSCNLVNFDNAIKNKFPAQEYVVVASNSNNQLQVFSNLSTEGFNLGVYKKTNFNDPNSPLVQVQSVLTFDKENLLPYIDEAILSDESYLNSGMLVNEQVYMKINNDGYSNSGNRSLHEDNKVMICKFIDI